MKITITIEVDERGAVHVSGAPASSPRFVILKDGETAPPPENEKTDEVPESPEAETMAPVRKKNIPSAERPAIEAKVREMHSRGMLDSEIAKELGLRKGQVSSMRLKLGLKGNGTFNGPAHLMFKGRHPKKETMPADAIVTSDKPLSTFANQCCGTIGLKHRSTCPGRLEKEIAETEERVAEAEEPEEPKEEKFYKCINQSCEDEGKRFGSTNDIPDVMCHSCGEREVVQVFD